jgi:hypothetical protein
MKQGPGPPFRDNSNRNLVYHFPIFPDHLGTWSSISLFFRLIRRNEEMDKQVQIRADSQKRLY